ncbi:hypothetical protein C7M51_02418 [Mixta intestinalis]|uniref:Uncharacterized protein n=1 Tax=Mixta intestinalis TaxID=1615494 RepID=A0A6P1Q298_9GAMM|nr:hypothetical protein C7M51_02418 [Mixta intestinalis]
MKRHYKNCDISSQNSNICQTFIFMQEMAA